MYMRWRQGQQTQGAAARRRVAERERRVELAAAEAAEDDPAFAPDVVRPQAAKLFTDIQSAWDARRPDAPARLVAPELLTEWERRLDDFDRKGWHNHVEVIEAPKVEYVGLTHRGGGDDRVVVRIEATLRDYVEDNYGNRIGRVDSFGDRNKVREFWTLGQRDGHWILLSIEQGAEGEHALREDIVATPWSDEKSMRDEALVEGAVAEAVPEGTKLAEVADLDFGGDARAAALDSQPRRRPLRSGHPGGRGPARRGRVGPRGRRRRRGAAPIARPQAARDMLHPGDPSGRTRLVVRGLEVRQITIAALDAAAEPPTMTIDVELAGRRYLEDRDTARWSRAASPRRRRSPSAGRWRSTVRPSSRGGSPASAPPSARERRPRAGASAGRA